MKNYYNRNKIKISVTDMYVVYMPAIKKIYHRKKQKIKFNSSHNGHVHSVRVRCTSQNFKFF